MGATNFTTISAGKTATEAYTVACLQAESEYGTQDGYNGTISTTNGFKELSADLFKGLGKKARLIILDCIANGWAPEKKQLGAKGHQVYSSLAHLRAAEKWERCYALKISHNMFAFAGLAAC
tara:strand:- start:24735 stop:25100 length:366 start_codon:yes stop_codon:yes gene_type:complete